MGHCRAAEITMESTAKYFYIGDEEDTFTWKIARIDEQIRRLNMKDRQLRHGSCSNFVTNPLGPNDMDETLNLSTSPIPRRYASPCTSPVSSWANTDNITSGCPGRRFSSPYVRSSSSSSSDSPVTPRTMCRIPTSIDMRGNTATCNQITSCLASTSCSSHCSKRLGAVNHRSRLCSEQKSGSCNALPSANRFCKKPYPCQHNMLCNLDVKAGPKLCKHTCEPESSWQCHALNGQVSTPLHEKSRYHSRAMEIDNTQIHHEARTGWQATQNVIISESAAGTGLETHLVRRGDTCEQLKIHHKNIGLVVDNQNKFKNDIGNVDGTVKPCGTGNSEGSHEFDPVIGKFGDPKDCVEQGHPPPVGFETKLQDTGFEFEHMKGMWKCPEKKLEHFAEHANDLEVHNSLLECGNFDLPSQLAYDRKIVYHDQVEQELCDIARIKLLRTELAERDHVIEQLRQAEAEIKQQATDEMHAVREQIKETIVHQEALGCEIQEAEQQHQKQQHIQVGMGALRGNMFGQSIVDLLRTSPYDTIHALKDLIQQLSCSDVI